MSSNCSVAECFPEKSSWCWTEQGMKFNVRGCSVKPEDDV